MGTVWPGLVPQVTVGVISAQSISISRSNFASGSLLSVRQTATARSQSTPLGANGRPLSQAKVVSSGGMMPVKAPNSTAMLQMVKRFSCGSAAIVGPVNSIA